MQLPSRQAIETFAEKVVRLREEYEFRTFWMSTRVPGPIPQAEAVALRRKVNSLVGARIAAITKELTARLESPDLRVTLDLADGSVSARAAPLFVYGRYLKFSREMPQSKWPCRWCRGAGCARCGGTGARYARTVEGLLAEELLPLTGAAATKFHSAGREDVDARMLGSGRPFVLELLSPRRRTFDAAAVQRAFNEKRAGEAEVRELCLADSAILRAVHDIKAEKTYRAAVRCLVPAPRAALGRLAALEGAVIRQETPRRVLHRRPNVARRRAVRSCAFEAPEGDPVLCFTLTLRVEAGTYIKELISGDEGRSFPSVSHLLGRPCDCAELDVLEVHCDPLRQVRGG